MTLAQAVGECGKWGNFMRALAKVDEVAKFVANLAQQESELKRSIELLKIEQQAAADARDRATADAVSIRQASQSDASAIVESAKLSAVELREEANDKVRKAQEQAAHANDEFLAAEQLRDEARKDTAAVTSELDRLRKQIDEAKAEALRRFGG